MIFDLKYYLEFMEHKLCTFVAFTFTWKLVLKGILGVIIWFSHSYSTIELEFKIDFFEILCIQRITSSYYKFFLVTC